VNDDGGGAAAETIPVRVVLALPDRAREIALRVPVGTGARAGLHRAIAAGLSLAGSELEAGDVALGVFGRRVADDTPLQADDRLELYRPLHQDPMARRRREARRPDQTRSAVRDAAPRPGPGRGPRRGSG